MHLTMRTLDRPIFGGKRRPSGAFLQRHPPESFNSGSKCIFDMRYDDRVKTMEQNASSLALYLGKRGVLRCEYLSVDVTIVDAKRSYGRTLLLVRPISASGWDLISLTVTSNS